MLLLDIKKFCNNIGIEDPKRWLVKHGFSHVDAHRLVTQPQVGITYVKLEKLCLTLNCTPNDVISWRPKEGSTVAATHPLQKLKQENRQDSINAKLQALSPEKLAEVKRYLDGLG